MVLLLILTRRKLSASLNDAETIARRLALSEEQLVYMEVISPTILFEMQVVGGQLEPNWISKNLTRITGYGIEEALNPLWWKTHLHADDSDRLLNEFKTLFSDQYHTYEYRFWHKNGSILWIRDERQVVCDKNGSPYHVLAAWSDITGRKKEELDLRIAAIALETEEAIIITDKHARIVRVNGAFTRMTGYSMEEAIGNTPGMLQSGRHNEEFYRLMWDELNRNLHWEGEIWDRHKNGNVYPVWMSITGVTDSTGEVTNYVSTCFDISERKEAEEYIKNLAFYDSLTHLPNRRLMLDRLNLALTVSHRTNQHGALMFMDLDRFKILNDTQGHDIGDRLLIEVARRIQTCIREGDTVARMGGDEFVVMLENLSKNQKIAAVQTQAIAEKIREALAATYWLPPHNHKRNRALIEHHSSASIGIVLFQGQSISCEDLLKRADLAMYQAKHAGSDTIRMFDPAMQSALNERTALEADLRQSLSRNELALYYQIQVDTLGRPVGAEALLCWNQSHRGIVPTEKFIPLAEETGLILNIGEWVLQQGCVTLASWAKNPATRDLNLALNVSPRQFRQPDFVEHLLLTIEEAGADPKRLILEITELTVMENLEETLEKMRAIRQFGVRFAMDDFGTGYSSLSNLLRLPLDQLKIDRGFIGDLSEEDEDAAIIRSVLLLGKSLHLTVIAEGVETKMQQRYLIEHGCPVFQGYYFGKPVLLAEFEAALTKHSRVAEIHQIRSK
ncbi:MAG: bifunctional diguanylate cyclase/phosphodiesterase [Gammaproteobacteria bacterium]